LISINRFPVFSARIFNVPEKEQRSSFWVVPSSDGSDEVAPVPIGSRASQLNRMRLITEIAEAVRAHWPEQKPLFVRLSVEDNAGWAPERSVRLAKVLKD
jgi:hypothetical protein